MNRNNIRMFAFQQSITDRYPSVTCPPRVGLDTYPYATYYGINNKGTHHLGAAMHTEYDTQTVTNTLALYRTPRTNGYYIRRGLARMGVYMALLSTVVLLPHAIAYAVVPHHTDDDMRASLSVPCPTEDSTNCFWDATLHGNGEGRSFVDIDGTLYYQD